MAEGKKAAGWLKTIQADETVLDTIIFGKLNYNVESTSYVSDNKNFYEECAQQVVNFCEKNNIDYHIKFGTRKEHIPKTTILFDGASKIPVLVE
ncbi:MAG: hypothetical protein KJ583_04630 [Nanoarchaeota archaeon]|nr:hypothetical protein [Nanoarchaeota archaeon]MBU1270183.1 hypothetical protein [Nanoarchaeota archaeon]MBU1604578.1 hypothetical protein [Nanoarchaeota archaeon]MBU2443599.1 hypothetical protein [Nanoarchaeota archaeon]